MRSNDECYGRVSTDYTQLIMRVMDPAHDRKRGVTYRGQPFRFHGQLTFRNDTAPLVHLTRCSGWCAARGSAIATGDLWACYDLTRADGGHLDVDMNQHSGTAHRTGHLIGRWPSDVELACGIILSRQHHHWGINGRRCRCGDWRRNRYACKRIRMHGWNALSFLPGSLFFWCAPPLLFSAEKERKKGEQHTLQDEGGGAFLDGWS